MGIVQIQDAVGVTPLVSLNRLTADSTCQIIAKLESYNPSGSIKDRIIRRMLRKAEDRGEIEPGDTLVEATSGSTGIALALAAAKSGYRAILVLPDHVPAEMRTIMATFGAELMPVPGFSNIEQARDLAKELERQGVGQVLDQFSNEDNPDAHYRTTGPEIWNDSDKNVTHFVSSMGTTGTIVGVSRYLKEQNPKIETIGVNSTDGGQISGMQSWSLDYRPGFYTSEYIDGIVEISPELAGETSRRLAREEGILAGVSSGAAIAAALRLSRRLENAVIATVIFDRGERYLSTGLYD